MLDAEEGQLALPQRQPLRRAHRIGIIRRWQLPGSVWRRDAAERAQDVDASADAGARRVRAVLAGRAGALAARRGEAADALADVRVAGRRAGAARVGGPADARAAAGAAGVVAVAMLEARGAGVLRRGAAQRAAPKVRAAFCGACRIGTASAARAVRAARAAAAVALEAQRQALVRVRRA